MPDLDLEKADERIQAICDKIRLEVLDPSKLEAQEIIEQANKEASQILEKAKNDAQKVFEELKQKSEQEQRIFTAALDAASKQTIEFLKQKIEEALFNPSLEEWLHNQLGKEQELASLINVILAAIEKEGLETDLSIKIPQTISPEKILSLLSQKMAARLKASDITCADIKGGVKITLKNKHMTIDLSQKTLQEIITSFLRKEFRRIFFTQ